MKTRTLRSVVYLAAGIGLIVSLFAAAEIIDAALLKICTVNTFVSCAAVAQSGKTTTFGIPDYLVGIGGFILIIIFNGVGERRPEHKAWVWALLALTTVGVAYSAWLLYVELVLIGAICLVCASAYVMGIVAWAGAIGLVRARPTETRPRGSKSTDVGVGLDSVG